MQISKKKEAEICDNIIRALKGEEKIPISKFRDDGTFYKDIHPESCGSEHIKNMLNRLMGNANQVREVLDNNNVRCYQLTPDGNDTLSNIEDRGFVARLCRERWKTFWRWAVGISTAITVFLTGWSFYLDHCRKPRQNTPQEISKPQEKPTTQAKPNPILDSKKDSGQTDKDTSKEPALLKTKKQN